MIVFILDKFQEKLHMCPSERATSSNKRSNTTAFSYLSAKLHRQMRPLIRIPRGSARGQRGWVKGSINFNESITQTDFLVQIGTRSRRSLDVMTEWAHADHIRRGVNPWTWESADAVWATRNTGRKSQQCAGIIILKLRNARAMDYYSLFEGGIAAHEEWAGFMGQNYCARRYFYITYFCMKGDAEGKTEMR